MDSTLTGFVGVVAGALTTGGVQVVINARQRRNDALAAARITWGALSNAASVIEESVQEGEWLIGAQGLERSLSIWHEHRMAVARVVDGYGYQTLEVAFRRLGQTLEQAGSFDADGLHAVATDPTYPGDLVLFTEGRVVALRAARTRWERIRDPRKGSKLEARVKAANASAEVHLPLEGTDDTEDGAVT
jgi:hypothetical protein